MIDDVTKASFSAPMNKLSSSVERVASFSEAAKPPVPPAVQKEPSKQDLEDSVQRVNQSLKLVNTSLEIKLDKEVNEKVVMVLNNQSGEVIRQIPSEKFLEWEKEYAKLLGLLFDEKR